MGAFARAGDVLQKRESEKTGCNEIDAGTRGPFAPAEPVLSGVVLIACTVLRVVTCVFVHATGRETEQRALLFAQLSQWFSVRVGRENKRFIDVAKCLGCPPLGIGES